MKQNINTKNKKLIYIDIGTHKGQEFDALGMNNFKLIYKLFKHNLLSFFSKNHKFINISKKKSLIKSCNFLKKNKNKIFSILIEPNFQLFQNKCYKNADIIMACSISNSLDKDVNLNKLYIPLKNEYSQSSSLYKTKFTKLEVSTNFITTLSLNSLKLFEVIKYYLENESIDYDNIVLRVNNEGNEDECIFSIMEIFKNKDIFIMGSLEDVKKIKGDQKFNNLKKFLDDKKMNTYKFNTVLDSWIEPLFVIKNLIN